MGQDFQRERAAEIFSFSILLFFQNMIAYLLILIIMYMLVLLQRYVWLYILHSFIIYMRFHFLLFMVSFTN